MIAASLLLVVLGFILLLLGVLEVAGQPLTLVYASIGACLVAALLLAIGVLRQRPRRGGTSAVGGAGQDASWSGASAWGGERDDDLPTALPAPAPWSTVSEAQEAEARRLDAFLADVPGLDAQQRAVLRERYGSITALGGASRDELLAIEGMSEAAADRVLDAMA